MPNYKETNVSGTSWVRSPSILVSNIYNELPSITFMEEVIYNLDQGIVKGPYMGSLLPGIVETFSTPTTQFTLLNPMTDEVIGMASYQNLQVILYSMYRHLADARDIRDGTNLSTGPEPQVS